MSRLGGGQICGGFYKSLRPLHNALIRGVPRGYGWHRSPYTCVATNQLETNRACNMHPDSAPIGRVWPYLDVEAHGARPPDTLQIHVKRPTDARRALHEIGVLELLGHGASQPAQSSHTDAKNTSGSKLPITVVNLRHCQHLRGGAR